MILSVKQGDIEYHLLSLWYDSTRVIGKHSNRLANGPVLGIRIYYAFISFTQMFLIVKASWWFRVITHSGNELADQCLTFVAILLAWPYCKLKYWWKLSFNFFWKLLESIHLNTTLYHHYDQVALTPRISQTLSLSLSLTVPIILYPYWADVNKSLLVG